MVRRHEPKRKAVRRSEPTKMKKLLWIIFVAMVALTLAPEPYRIFDAGGISQGEAEGASRRRHARRRGTQLSRRRRAQLSRCAAWTSNTEGRPAVQRARCPSFRGAQGEQGAAEAADCGDPAQQNDAALHASDEAKETKTGQAAAKGRAAEAAGPWRRQSSRTA